MDSRALGLIGEEKAISWLVQKGYKIISRNYRKRNFEVDIIALDSKSVLRFIEVKNVVTGHFEDAVFNVEKRNMLRYFDAVDSFLLENPIYRGGKMCMDVLIIHLDKIHYYENVTSDLVS